MDGDSGLMTISQALNTTRQFDDANLRSFHSEPPVQGDREATWSSLLPLDGGNIYVSLEGPREAPALVLVHGLAGSTRWWDPLVSLLVRSHRVIRIDLLGHGKSAKPTGRGYAMAEQGQRVGAVLDRLGVQS